MWWANGAWWKGRTGKQYLAVEGLEGREAGEGEGEVKGAMKDIEKVVVVKSPEGVIENIRLIIGRQGTRVWQGLQELGETLATVFTEVQILRGP